MRVRFSAFVLPVFTVVCVFAQSPEDSDIKKLIKQLGSDDWLRRKEAEEALLRFGEKAGPALVEAMKSGDAEIRERAKRIIERTGYAPPEVREKCDHLLQRLLKTRDILSLSKLKDMLKGEDKFFVRNYLSFFFRGGKGPVDVTLLLDKRKVFCNETVIAKIVIENKSDEVVWIPQMYFRIMMRIYGTNLRINNSVCFLRWGTLGAYRLKPRQKLTLQKRFSPNYEGVGYDVNISVMQPRKLLEKLLEEDLRPQTAHINLLPQSKNKIIVLPPKDGRTHTSYFSFKNTSVKVKLQTLLKVESSNGVNKVKVSLKIKSAKEALKQILKGLKDSLKKGSFPLMGGVLMEEGDDIKAVVFDGEAKIEEGEDSILVFWERDFKGGVFGGRLWGCVWGRSRNWGRGMRLVLPYRPVISRMRSIEEEEEF